MVKKRNQKKDKKKTTNEIELGVEQAQQSTENKNTLQNKINLLYEVRVLGLMCENVSKQRQLAKIYTLTRTDPRKSYNSKPVTSHQYHYHLRRITSRPTNQLTKQPNEREIQEKAGAGSQIEREIDYIWDLN